MLPEDVSDKAVPFVVAVVTDFLSKQTGANTDPDKRVTHKPAAIKMQIICHIDCSIEKPVLKR